MRILVTGSAGFIGSAVASAAEAAGHEVHGADVAGPGRRDVRDLGRAIALVPFGAVVHCAAAVVSTAAKASAGAAVAENLEIDAALFRWAARARPGRVVYFSSSCGYPADCAGLPGQRLRESDIDLRSPWYPDGLYGWVKLTGEQVCAQLASDGVPVTVMRPFSVYGPGMRPGFAVSGFCAQARQRADPLVIWGDDSQVRDFIHVSDVAAATLAAIGQGIDGPVNLGTGRGTPLRDLARLVTRLAGYEPQLRVDESRPRGLPYLVADNARLRSFCEPAIALEQGIAGMLE